MVSFPPARTCFASYDSGTSYPSFQRRNSSRMGCWRWDRRSDAKSELAVLHKDVLTNLRRLTSATAGRNGLSAPVVSILFVFCWWCATPHGITMWVSVS